MKKYAKFTIVGTVLLVLPWYAACRADMFTTAMACIPALLFFLASFIMALARALTKKDGRYNLVILLASVVLTLSLALPMSMSNRGLYALTAQRIQSMKALRPVFLKYRHDNGVYPPTLDELVPHYVAEIPPELINSGNGDPYKRITYTLQGGGEPVFDFRTIRGPDSSASYNVHTDSLWHDQ